MLNTRSSATKVDLYFKKPVKAESSQARITVTKKNVEEEQLKYKYSHQPTPDWSSLINLGWRLLKSLFWDIKIYWDRGNI